MADWYSWDGDTLILNIRVQPKASSDEIIGPQDNNSIKVRITAPPVDGKANQHLVKFLAKAFGVAKSKVTLLKGETGRDKRLAIASPTRFPDAAKIGAPPSA